MVALLARFPRLRPPAVSAPVIPRRKRTDYPALAEDFEVLDRLLAPRFATCDLAALRGQHRYRRQQVLVIFGSALITGLGGLQAVFTDQRWPGLLLAALGLLLAASTRLAHERAAHGTYLAERVKAERLRGLYFRYLARTGRFAGPDRERQLRRAVLAIQAGKEPDE